MSISLSEILTGLSTFVLGAGGVFVAMRKGKADVISAKASEVAASAEMEEVVTHQIEIAFKSYETQVNAYVKQLESVMNLNRKLKDLLESEQARAEKEKTRFLVDIRGFEEVIETLKKESVEMNAIIDGYKDTLEGCRKKLRLFDEPTGQFHVPQKLREDDK